jgi:hypothetical protein
MYGIGDKTQTVYYELIENDGDDKGYFERRKNKDWADMPKLWGPFNQ